MQLTNSSPERHMPTSDKLSIQSISDGKDFEDRVVELFRSFGWTAHQTKASHDHGVDVIAFIDDEKIVIQCKCYTNWVSREAIQQIVYGQKRYRASRGIIVYTGKVSSRNIEDGKEVDIDFYHIDDLRPGHELDRSERARANLAAQQAARIRAEQEQETKNAQQRALKERLVKERAYEKCKYVIRCFEDSEFFKRELDVVTDYNESHRRGKFGYIIHELLNGQKTLSINQIYMELSSGRKGLPPLDRKILIWLWVGVLFFGLVNFYMMSEIGAAVKVYAAYVIAVTLMYYFRLYFDLVRVAVWLHQREYRTLPAMPSRTEYEKACSFVERFEKAELVSERGSPADSSSAGVPQIPRAAEIGIGRVHPSSHTQVNKGSPR